MDARLLQMIQGDIQLLGTASPAHALSQQTPQGCFYYAVAVDLVDLPVHWSTQLLGRNTYR